MPTLMQAIQKLRNYQVLPDVTDVSVRDLNNRFQPSPSGNVRSLLYEMMAARPQPNALEPLYKAPMPVPQDIRLFNSDNWHIDFSNAHLAPYDLTDAVKKNNALFDRRAAAAICAGLKTPEELSFYPVDNRPSFVEYKDYKGDAPNIYIPKETCLAAIAFADYFSRGLQPVLRKWVNDAISRSSPGWCGSIGPGTDTWYEAAGLLAGDKWYDVLGDHDPFSGDYDMSQMHLLPIAYRYYHVLTPDARQILIKQLLERGRIHRPNCDDTFTSRETPNDYSRAGVFFPVVVSIGPLGKKRMGETENHILTILTARYLTNQLLYQREPMTYHDNRRNGEALHGPYTTEIILILLRNILCADFSEYNSKNYLTETRSAILNLHNYAYDHEVRLAARMVLDYLSARMATSSNDLRRMVPFRRRNEGKNVTRLEHFPGYMGIGLLESRFGADPSTQPFAMLAGNLRAYETTTQNRPDPWSMRTDYNDGNNAVMNVISEYRLPPPIHDLFVNDLHRRFFQRLHRTEFEDPDLYGLNCDNMEIYAGSPSYLITAGGSPAKYSVDPYFAFVPFGKNRQQKGVAMTTSFMPTGQSGAPNTGAIAENTLVQFSSFSEDFDDPPKVENYGVAPDFVCGHRVFLPRWCSNAMGNDRYHKFVFANKKGEPGRPGFYLALYSDRFGAVMEAFDTWLHPEVEYADFVKGVKERNSRLEQTGVLNDREQEYTTHNGNRITFKIWHDGDRFGAEVTKIVYGNIDFADSIGDAGNVKNRFLNGTVINADGNGKVEITNVFLGQTISLDMTQASFPKRRSETGEWEEAGHDNEVWVRFDSDKPREGDFFHPFTSIGEAVDRVAGGGIVRIMPGETHERLTIRTNKRITIRAQVGGVVFRRH